MTDEEFDVLDELYFVQPYAHLKDELELDDAVILTVLKSLLSKGWVKCYTQMDEEVFGQNIDLDNHFERYLYLATKKGLMAHNGR